MEENVIRRPKVMVNPSTLGKTTLLKLTITCCSCSIVHFKRFFDRIIFLK